MSMLDESPKVLSESQSTMVLNVLEERFKNNMRRHEGMTWKDVLARLESARESQWSLQEMERTGGEPDVIGFDKMSGEFIYCDRSTESPKGRRNVCYDLEGQVKRERQGIHPAGSAMAMAEYFGIEIMTEEQYSRPAGIGRIR